MDYIDPPPPPPFGKKRKKPSSHEGLPTDGRRIVIEKAKVGDVAEILELVNGFAASNLMLPRGPQYLYENIRDFVIACDHAVPVYSMTATREDLYLLVGCASLHALWGDIAEIRALAIHPDYQKLGIARSLFLFMKREAKKLGIKHIYTFTMSEGFFETLGFVRQKRNQLPPKVWGECSRCPKYFQCDEVGMALDL